MFKVFSDEELFASLDKDKIQLFADEFQKAKDGYESVLVYIGDVYYDRKDYSKALGWYLKGVNVGSSVAQTNIGYLYQNGFGVSLDYSEAMKWYIKGAESRNGTAQFDLGCMYQKGLAVPVDYKQAMDWYLKAAFNGSSDAQTSIGYLYHQGLGVPVDYQQAMYWYLKAVEKKEDVITQNNIGELYLRGLGTAKDVLKAIEWFRKPAERGVDESQYYFGWICEHEDKFKDLQKAVNWYQKASDSGYEEAKFAVKRLKEKAYYPTVDYKGEKEPQMITNTLNSNKPRESVTHHGSININNYDQELPLLASQKDQDKITLMETRIKKLEETVQLSLNLIQQDREEKDSLKQKLQTLEQENAKIKADQKEKDEEYKQLKEMVMQIKIAADDNLSHDTSYDFVTEASDHKNKIKYEEK